MVKDIGREVDERSGDMPLIKCGVSRDLLQGGADGLTVGVGGADLEGREGGVAGRGEMIAVGFEEPKCAKKGGGKKKEKGDNLKSGAEVMWERNAREVRHDEAAEYGDGADEEEEGKGHRGALGEGIHEAGEGC